MYYHADGCGYRPLDRYGYGYGCLRSNFVLIVVLFILLIIVGVCWRY